MKALIIIRGISGSGKTTLAGIITPNTIFDIHIEADQHLYNEEGEYIWTKDSVWMAHQQCMRRVKKAMMENYHRVVLSNTSVKNKDLKGYKELAKEYGYKVFSMVLENTHDGQNLHGVGDEQLKEQALSLKNNIKII